MTNSLTGMVRVDVRENYLQADKPHLNFWQKVGRGFTKALSIGGQIGAGVLAVTGVGLPFAAGLYGISNVAGQIDAHTSANDAARMNDYYKQNASKPVATPGLFEQDSVGGQLSDFMVPQSMNNQASLTIQNREASLAANVQNFNF